MGIFGCGFNGFSQLFPFGNCIELEDDVHTKSKSETDTNVGESVTSSVLTLKKLHLFSNPAKSNLKTNASDIREHPQSNALNSDYPKELSVTDSSVGWDKIAIQFGDGRLQTFPNNPPSAVASVPFIRTKSVAVSWRDTFIVDKNGKCLKLDNSATGVSTVDVSDDVGDGDGHEFLQVASGDLYTAVVSDSFHVWLMNNQHGDCILRPISLRQHIKSVCCGKEHVLLLSRIGIIMSMGIGSRGQLGHGDTENQSEPRVIEDLEAVIMVTMSAGGWHSTAVSDIGDVYTWGWNESGQLGLPCRTVQDQRVAAGTVTSDMARSSPLTPASAVSAGQGFQATVSGEDGKHGVTDPSDCITPSPTSDDHARSAIEYVNLQTIPVVIDFPYSPEEQEVMVSKVSCGSRHTAVVTEAGDLWTWGWNAYGQLGLGDTVCRDMPTRVNGHLKDVQDVYCGCWTTIVVTKDT